MKESLAGKKLKDKSKADSRQSQISKNIVVSEESMSYNTAADKEREVEDIQVEMDDSNKNK